MNGTALRIGVIGGAGWLGAAIARSILEQGIVSSSRLTLSFRSKQARGLDEVLWTQDNQELVDRSDVVIVSVRPEDWRFIPAKAVGKLIVSVMAGVRLDQLAAFHQTGRIVRALPNAAAEVGKSYTPWVAATAVSKIERSLVQQIFSACGVADEVATEADIDYLTGLSGTGPAFPALLATAMMRDAEAHGISGDIARRAVNTILIGTGRLLEKRDESPADTVDVFLGYRGVTAAAIETMRASGFDEAVANGLTAALKKCASMGEAF